MKKNLSNRLGAILAIALLSVINASSLRAQTAKVADKELIGTWLLESMQFEGEKKVECGINYTQVKFFGPNGEYACAEVVKQKDGSFVILPHEYGTYTFKNGKYTEMGRDGIVQLVDKTTFKGRWKNRHDVWKKSVNMPAKLTEEIVSRCKASAAPQPEIQKLIGQYMFK